MRPAPEDTADDAFDQREYPIPERLESQRRAWRFERAGLWVLLGVILLALTGVFAGGPLSSRTLVSDSGRLTLAYERFERSGAASRLRIDLRGAPGTGLACAWAADCYRRTASRACNRNRCAVTAGGVAWNWREGSTKTVA